MASFILKAFQPHGAGPVNMNQWILFPGRTRETVARQAVESGCAYRRRRI